MFYLCNIDLVNLVNLSIFEKCQQLHKSYSLINILMSDI